MLLKPECPVLNVLGRLVNFNMHLVNKWIITVCICNLLTGTAMCICVTYNRHIAFEIAIGMNGLLWIQANSEEECIILRNAILNSMDLDEFQTEAMVEIMVDKLKLLRGRKHGHGT